MAGVFGDPRRRLHGTGIAIDSRVRRVAPYLLYGDPGAVIERELADQPYGDRSYAATDLEGHQWFIATRVEDMDPEEWSAVSAPSCDVVEGRP